jgi:hypothetical protein
MDLLKDIIRQYGANLVALAVFAAAAVRYCRLHDAFDINDHLGMVVFAFGGFAAFIGSEEWSDWSGRYGLTRQQWWTTPAVYIRVGGGILLVYYTVALYRL